MTPAWTRRLRALLSPPMLVALLALAVATGGTSYAVAKVTSADIRNHTIKMVDLAPRTVATLQAGTGRIPSGRTVTGSSYYRIAATAANQPLEQSIALPAPAPAAMTAADFAPDSSFVTTDDDAACTGSYDAPTAPAGMLCAYLATPVNFATTDVKTADISTLEPGEDLGFVVRLTTVDAGTIAFDFSWAYTAP